MDTVWSGALGMPSQFTASTETKYTVAALSPVKVAEFVATTTVLVLPPAVQVDTWYNVPAGLFSVQDSVAEVKYTAVKAVSLGGAARV